MTNQKRSSFIPNRVPVINDQQLILVEGLREKISSLMNWAHRFGLEGVRQVVPDAELEYDIDNILNRETIEALVAAETATRPLIEERGLELVFEKMLRTIMQSTTAGLFQYGVKVDARCMGCLSEADFRSGAGFMAGVDYTIGVPQPLKNFLDGGWKTFVVSDAVLGADENLREELTPACKLHGKKSVIQLAVVHRVTGVDTQSNVRKPKGPYIKQEAANAAADVPILEARLKTTFEYLWKYVKVLEGERKSINDFLAARIRAPSEKDMALALVYCMMSLPQRNWYGLVLPQNFDNFNGWMSRMLEGENGLRGYFRTHIAPNVISETKELKIHVRGVEEPAKAIEFLAPLGPDDTVVSSNNVDTLIYTDEGYTRMLGTVHDRSGLNLQSRIGYQRRREDSRRETSVLADWLLARRLACISLDTSSVSYNLAIVNNRLEDARRH